MLAALLALAGCAAPADKQDGSGASAVPPTAAEPSTVTPDEPACESDGLLVRMGVVDAALGERQAPLILTACGDEPVTIDQLPSLSAGDEEGNEVPIHFEPQAEPTPITVQPGQQATAILNWRNTTQSGAAANAVYVDVVVLPGGPAHRVYELIDTGTTSTVKLYPWTV